MKDRNYPGAPSESEIAEKVEFYKKEMHKLKTKENLIQMLNCVDLTSLNASDTEAKIAEMTEKVNNFNEKYPDYKNVAAICVYPALVPTVLDNLELEDVNIAAVGACFPASQTFLSVKSIECEMAVEKGADEIDIVISVGKFLEEYYQTVSDEIYTIRQAIGDAKLKVILETGELKTPDNIYIASVLAMESGADFIKTSTGKTPVSATPEAVYVMCRAIKDYYEATGEMIGLKPAGGMSATDDALIYYAIVKDVLG
ncbi:MAG: deoxyribose-phosphate aldolase, partial [Bacteroidales bacterium]|nr:deoxyribose-phosphate aldolase [Bacteroidales bacterium]